ncbi:MAG: phosphotransferase, partial [Candidatus Latescibacterota bacterium]
MSGISSQSIKAVLAGEYGIECRRITRLTGENENYLIQSADGRESVLKFAGADQNSESIELENVSIEQASRASVGLDLPRFIPTGKGRIEATVHLDDGQTVSARLTEYVAGTSWCDAMPVGQPQARDLGRTLAKLDLELAKVTTHLIRRTHRWDLTKASQHRRVASLIGDTKRRRIFEWYFQLYSACALPFFKNLPHTLIHNDANDENVLLRDGEIAGLLDFGDCLYNPTVCEVAIAIAYAMLDQPDPLPIGAALLSGYYSERRLSPEEIAVIYPLICGRWCVTVAVAAERRQIDPDHPDWFVTEERAWRSLERFTQIEPYDATKALTARIPTKAAGPRRATAADMIEKRNQHISGTLSVAYEKPLIIVRGRGQFLHDNRGRPFLDLVNNVCHVGHCHTRVAAAGQKQMARLNTNTRYLYPELSDYAERICAKLP